VETVTKRWGHQGGDIFIPRPPYQKWKGNCPPPLQPLLCDTSVITATSNLSSLPLQTCYHCHFKPVTTATSNLSSLPLQTCYHCHFKPVTTATSNLSPLPLQTCHHCHFKPVITATSNPSTSWIYRS
jgi:hypothetical protein